MIIKICIPVIIVLSLSCGYSFAEIEKPTAKPSSQAPSSSDQKIEEPKAGTAAEKLSVTRHSINIHGQSLSYTATAGCLTASNEIGKQKAKLFFVAYVKDTGEDISRRPITFAFNGGPGASSVWLHMGAIGPKRAVLQDEGRPSIPPYRFIDNEYSWLPFTDLVFIDPVGTGFSRAAPGENANEFYGIKGDIQSVGEFIRLYVSKYGRWLSPKFLAGESYGTFRAVGLSKYLFDNFGMEFNGLVLVSLALDFQTFSFGPGNDLPFVLFLPSYTAAAWFHKRLDGKLQQQELPNTLKESEDWAMNEYLRALVKGCSLSDAEKNVIVEKLAYYTGLDQSYIDTHQLRVNRNEFRSELLRNENRVIGLLDSRASTSSEFGGSGIYSDPGISSTIGPCASAVNDYLKSELQYENDLPYVFLSLEVNSHWDWGSASNGYVKLMTTLQEVMNRSTSMKVFVASGRFDLDTPYSSATYTVQHLGLNSSLFKNITMKYYDSGHQVYTNLDALKELTADVGAFERSLIHAD